MKFLTGYKWAQKNTIMLNWQVYLEGFLKAIIANKGGKLTPMWREGYSALLNVYLGEYPHNFLITRKSYTPKSFAKN